MTEPIETLDAGGTGLGIHDADTEIFCQSCARLRLAISELEKELIDWRWKATLYFWLGGVAMFVGIWIGGVL